MSALFVMLAALAFSAAACLTFLLPWGVWMLVRYAWTLPPWYWHDVARSAYSSGAPRVRRMYPPEVKP